MTPPHFFPLFTKDVGRPQHTRKTGHDPAPFRPISLLKPRAGPLSPVSGSFQARKRVCRLRAFDLIGTDNWQSTGPRDNYIAYTIVKWRCVKDDRASEDETTLKQILDILSVTSTAQRTVVSSQSLDDIPA